MDETYDLLGTVDLNVPLQVLGSNLVATPPERVFANLTCESQRYFHLRLVP